MKKYLLPLLSTFLWLIPAIVQAQTYNPSNRRPAADNSQIGTIVTPTGNNFNITGGLRRGQNLLHSFSDFSIPTGGAANFTNPQGNRSIITRVTGNLFSDINGLLNTNGANFLLINPHGVVFGTGARLNVGKAFVTSTASGVDFVDAQGRNYNFGANRAGDAPLLTIDPNVAFNPARLIMNANISGSRGIENYGTLRTSNPGQYVGLIGGDVSFNGGSIFAPGGRVDIGGLNSAGTVSIGKEGLVFTGNGLTYSDISVNGSVIDVSADRKLEGINAFFSNTSFLGSSLNISGNNVQIDTVALTNGLAKNSGIQTAPTGGINIDAMGKLTLNVVSILNNIEPDAEGQIGNFNINADSLVANDLYIGTAPGSRGKGGGGDLNIKTRGNFNVTNSLIDTGTGGQGDAAPTTITANGNLTLANSTITTGTAGQGDAGQITINTNGKLLMDNSQIDSQVDSIGVGNSKGIKIDAGEIELTNQSGISTSTRQSAVVNGKGNAGDIDLKTTGNLTIIKDSFIDTSTFGKGDAGKITINTNGKLFLDDSQISSAIVETGLGNSKGIKIDAGEIGLSNQSYIFTDTRQSALVNGKGNAGDIDLKTTGNLIIANSFIITNTSGQGDAGKITINTNGKLFLDDSQISSAIVETGLGNSKGIKIDAGEIGLSNQSYIFTDTRQSALVNGTGNAGDVDLTTTGDLIITNSFINTNTSGQGDAGKITINTNGNLFVDKGRITSQITSTGVGNSKGIKIDAGELVLANQSAIRTDTGQFALVNGKGNAGDIDLKTTGSMIIDHSGIYSISSGSGNTGKINLDAQNPLIIVNGVVQNSIYSRLVDKDGIVLGNGNFEVINIITPNQQYSYLSINGVGNWPRVTANTSVGNSQTISIKAPELILVNSSIVSGTGAKGNTGDIKIATTGDVDIFSSTISTNIGRYGEGKTGKISIDTGGKLTLDNSQIQSIVAGGTGDSQGIDLKANKLSLLDNSGIFSQTSGKGNAGDIRITTPGDTILDKSLIYSSSSSLSFSPTETPLSSFFPVPDLKGTKYSSGSIDIASKGLFLNGSNIVSASELGQGGNIKFNLSDKLLLRGIKESFSTISTDAGIDNGTVISGNNNGDFSISVLIKDQSVSQANRFDVKENFNFFDNSIRITQDRASIAKTNNTNSGQLNSLDRFGNGGNITISSPLIIALPGNNDITANAYQGAGGKVQIDSQGLFGIQYRPTGSLFTNDITASSTFGQDGKVEISTPGTDPGKNKGELTVATNDASKQISQACGASQRDNKFYITGRGGLPPNASEPQESYALWADARAVQAKAAPTASLAPKYAPPAIGLVLEPNGRARLIAAQMAVAPTGTSVLCHK